MVQLENLDQFQITKFMSKIDLSHNNIKTFDIFLNTSILKNENNILDLSNNLISALPKWIFETG